MKRRTIYPCVVPSIDSSINSQDYYNNHSLIDYTFGVSSHNNPNSIQSSIHNKIIGPEDFNINIIVYTSVDLIKDSRVPIQKVQLKLFYFLTFEEDIIILFSINVMLLELWLVCNGIPNLIDILWIFLIYLLHNIFLSYTKTVVCCYLVYLWHNDGMMYEYLFTVS